MSLWPPVIRTTPAKAGITATPTAMEPSPMAKTKGSIKAKCKAKTKIRSSPKASPNLNVAEGGAGGRGGDGGNSNQNQSQISDNSNSSNNSSSQSTSVTFESTGEAEHANKYGNNVNAYSPNVYASGTCLGGVSAGAAGMGFGVSVGGTKKDEECSVRENARILASLDPALSLIYLCSNPLVDIGEGLGAACKPSVKPA